MSINEIVHKALMAGIGIPEKVTEIIDDLVKKGELSESQGATLVKECSDKVEKSGDDISKSISEILDKTLDKMNIPTRSDVEKLNKKLTTLSARVKKLEDSQTKT